MNNNIWFDKAVSLKWSLIPHKRRNCEVGLTREDAFIELLVKHAEELYQEAIDDNDYYLAYHYTKEINKYLKYGIKLKERLIRKSINKRHYLYKNLNRI